jgi:diguanylate cyclase (GGDEF)-like protein
MRHKFLNLFNSLFFSLGRGGIFSFVIFLVLLLGWLDYWVGYELSTSFFYLFPLGLATWYLNRRSGYLVALCCVVIWDIANRANGQVLSSELIRYWNMGIRMASYSVVVLVLGELKLAIQVERAIARTDHLTGIFNSREFTEQLGFEIQRADRLMYPVTLAYIDLDNFKQVNDEQGHSSGDVHLKLIAQTIAAVVRKTDLFARLGGDEFGLFLPNVDSTTAKIVIEKICKAVMQELNDIRSPVTLSVGVVTFKTLPISVDEMIHKADAMMYQAKLTGKNQVVYFEVD